MRTRFNLHLTGFWVEGPRSVQVLFVSKSSGASALQNNTFLKDGFQNIQWIKEKIRQRKTAKGGIILQNH